MEINEKIPPGISFEVSYSPDLKWENDHFYGCSLTTAHHKLKSHGYKLVKLVMNNAIFMPEELGPDITELDPCLAYRDGYLEAPNRKSLFPWNDEVEHWQRIDPDSAIIEIKSLFMERSGEFDIQVIACSNHTNLSP